MNDRGYDRFREDQHDVLVICDPGLTEGRGVACYNRGGRVGGYTEEVRAARDARERNLTWRIGD